ncbi:glycosyltransferase [Bifidobacterium sp. LC6]|uniref:Glycosyltransferase n=1 Tax=Bifidobacterium colobi TaxID=2809026 RepID=A0ABS5UX18_9BIFI|nr:glycosyltransferase family 2 protein [Bifidobacterium colobi]MBT1175657.1 glycosyltransferase [Bifidobacterium colobi]
MPHSQPLVSIIVPVYNAEDYLHYCVDSILGQSYTNLEVILVDDGAKDSSPVICDAYAAKDPRVIVIHQTNGGISKAQNTGLDAAHGEYIAFSDNDDILDSRNIEYLLHALVSTGADMSKGRWRQFGVSQLETVSAEAANGAEAPGKITVFEHPLTAYQSVFCKSFRLIGEKLGRNTEARYFNEANWCRLYKRELWDGLRFPVGHYAQDIRMAGPLYSRMRKVADVDATLYYWLQEPGSVTHSKRTAAFWHDNALSAAENFRFTLAQGVVPCRNYFGLVASVRDEGHGLKRLSKDVHFENEVDRKKFTVTAADRKNHEQDVAAMHELVSQLTPLQRLHCHLLYCIRSAENMVYDRKIHAMK